LGNSVFTDRGYPIALVVNEPLYDSQDSDMDIDTDTDLDINAEIDIDEEMASEINNDT
jgi:hypothetical protein